MGGAALRQAGSAPRVIAVIHMGLHKTGSTLVQYLAAYNAKTLRRAGVYFKPNIGYPAHHAEAAAVTQGDVRGLVRMTADAAAVGARTVLISSENLESLLFAPELALEIVAALRTAGCEEVVFALYVRDQAETFWSQYAELSRHVPIDAAQMLREVLHRGSYAVHPALSPEARLRQWCFCYDHERFVLPFREALAQAPGAHLRVYDFHRFARYPGDELFRDMGVGDRITRLPRGMIINPRLPPETVRANYRKLYARLADVELPAFLTLDESAERARRTQITRLLKERFAGVNERLLAACAVPATPGAVAGPTERRRA